VAVDYAHTPDALEKALLALRPLAQSRGGRLWCVFGCGGDRDPVKRPLMGAVAARLADVPCITSDNPRSEAPATIIAQIRAGMPADLPSLLAYEDRATAIATAVAHAASNDVILVAGKGHEDYQEIQGVKRPFSDMEQAQTALSLRTAKEKA
jgi:UDP-N-acetylmuramoyl-L-alanyl-D-glutamate--2,6-diaminopimelate ligase